MADPVLWYLNNVSVRMDDSLNEFEMLCSDFGMNISTSLQRLLSESPASLLKLHLTILLQERAMKASLSLREESAKNFPNGMALDEINSKISKVRSDKADKT